MTENSTGGTAERGKGSSQKSLAAAVATSAAALATFALVRYRNQRLNREAARLSAMLGAFAGAGARVAEVGAGKGAVAFRIAKHVGPAGLVIATEVDPKRLHGLREKAARLPVNNVSVLTGNETDSGLPPACCQGIYLRGAYHHFTAPQAMNRSLHDALRPGGLLVIIDFSPRLLLAPWTPKGIPQNRGGHGIREEMVIGELRGAGFRFLQKVTDWPGSNYCLLFQKP
jgi:ubiquinone/menaquinone biosynthesis C-methylase UbiE